MRIKTERSRYCRICWNTQRWQKPTGEAAKLEGTSFVSEYGFGHEEWLFNYSQMIDGYQYGFIQALNLKPKNVLRKLDLILYTVSPLGDKFYIARIEDCEWITPDIAKMAYGTYLRNGWLRGMIDDLKRINVDTKPLTDPNILPLEIINLRFYPDRVTYLDPLIRANSQDKVYTINRYKGLFIEEKDAWDRIIAKQAAKDVDAQFRAGKLKSTELRTRAAQRGTTYEPKHDQLQNALYKRLVAEFGSENVGYEKKGVDLAVKDRDISIYFEIKMDQSPKRCIRLALGQILEYAHWPNENRAQKFVIVGHVPLSEEGSKYLRFLREAYRIPIYYWRYDVKKDYLGDED